MSVDEHNRETLNKMLESVGKALANKMREVLLRENIPAWVNLRDNIYDSISYKVENGQLSVGSDSPHAQYVEYGRKPGNPPPFKPIHKWVIAKLGIEEPRATQVAWAIVRKIAEKGVEPTRFMYYSIQEFMAEANG